MTREIRQAIERRVRVHAASQTLPLDDEAEDQAVQLALAWYDAAAALGYPAADVDAARPLTSVAVDVVRLSRPPARAAPPEPVEPVEPVRPRDPQIVWFTTSQAAEHAGKHPSTLLKALESGELHGHQRKVKGRWRIHHECLNAWLAGEPCPHGSD